MTPTENVVPEEEINRRRRVNELAHEIGDLLSSAFADLRDVHTDMSERFTEIQQLATTKEFIPLVIEYGAPGIQDWIRQNLGREMLDPVFEKAEAMLRLSPEEISDFWGNLMGLTATDDSRHDKMVKLVNRILKDAPKMEGAAPDDQGAFECQIMLKNGYRAVGALAKTPEGLLKFLSVAQEDPQSAAAQGRKPRMVMAEHFFDYEDVQAIVIPHPVNEDKPKIFTGLD